jgi:hypothetical protein
MGGFDGRISHHRILARQGRNQNSEYLAQRRQGRKGQRITGNNFFKITYLSLRTWRTLRLGASQFPCSSILVQGRICTAAKTYNHSRTKATKHSDISALRHPSACPHRQAESAKLKQFEFRNSKFEIYSVYGAVSVVIDSEIRTPTFHFTQLRATFGFLHCTVLIGLEPMIDSPCEVCPVSDAEVSPHIIPVS